MVRLGALSLIVSNILFASLVVLCLGIAIAKINVETGVMLLIFDFLFISLTFQLNGTSIRKMGLLATGNAIGLFCNFAFVSISSAGSEYLGQGFRIFYNMLYPVINTLWIITFWSLSLTALPKNTKLDTETNV